jgi:hypothetical protein
MIDLLQLTKHAVKAKLVDGELSDVDTIEMLSFLGDNNDVILSNSEYKDYNYYCKITLGFENGAKFTLDSDFKTTINATVGDLIIKLESTIREFQEQGHT